MKRKTNLIFIVSFVFSISSWMFAQDAQHSIEPAVPAQVLGPQLIAWSQFQKPQPVPQPLPPPDRPTQAAEDQQPAQSASPADQQSPAAQTFVGKILKEDGKYVLKVSSTTAYQIFDQDRAKQYEGKQVKVAGQLDANGNSLHIVSIELMS